MKACIVGALGKLGRDLVRTRLTAATRWSVVLDHRASLAALTLVWKRYGHLYPGSAREAAKALDRHLKALAS